MPFLGTAGEHLWPSATHKLELSCPGKFGRFGIYLCCMIVALQPCVNKSNIAHRSRLACSTLKGLQLATRPTMIPVVPHEKMSAGHCSCVDWARHIFNMFALGTQPSGFTTTSPPPLSICVVWLLPYNHVSIKATLLIAADSPVQPWKGCSWLQGQQQFQLCPMKKCQRGTAAAWIGQDIYI